MSNQDKILAYSLLHEKKISLIKGMGEDLDEMISHLKIIFSKNGNNGKTQD